MSSVRFSELVKRYGQPEIKTLWTKPQEDNAFMHAVKKDRVLTLVQEPSAKRKDSGEIGFHQQPHAVYLVFPNTMKERKGVKVIGIKYDLIGEPDVTDALSAKSLQKAAPRKRAPKAAAPEKMETFQIRIRRVATIDSIVKVEAKTKKEARQRAVETAEHAGFDLSQATIKTAAV